MRLTSEVILRARVSINPLKERELDLRGYKIPAVENLGATKDGFDCIDFSDNEIQKLENFPRLKRLRMLLLNNNHISRISEGLENSIGNIEILILSKNKIVNLSEIDNLIPLKLLDTLCLAGNPVTKRKFYREYIIHKFPFLRVLDFQRIRPIERDAANRLFNSMIGKNIEKDIISADENSLNLEKDNTTTQKSNGQGNANISKQMSPQKSKIKASSSNSDAIKDVQMEDTSTAEICQEPFRKLSDVNEMEVEGLEEDEVIKPPSKPIESLKVSELRAELHQRNLSTTGLKADLVERLKKALNKS